jgi:hypothetical protein
VSGDPQLGNLVTLRESLCDPVWVTADPQLGHH